MYMVWGFLAGAVLAGLLFAVRNNGALAKLRAENADLRVENTKLTEEKNSARREKELVEEHFKSLAGTYQAQFAEVASKILDDKTKGLESKNTELLRPLSQHLDDFVKKVADMERQNIAAQARLEKGLTDVIKSTEKIDQSAVHLTSAIKGESIMRGAWGEEAVKRLLEVAGLKVGVDYFPQVTDSNTSKRVDYKIALPGGRWLMLDAKTIFNHYAAYFHAQDPKEKAALLAEHVKDIKNTIANLSAKKYPALQQAQSEKIQPDYTLMFVCPESALLTAVEAAPDILDEAWKHNIALVSATSLMSTLKLVSKLWDIDRQHTYMEGFKEDILKLVEKFNEFLVNFAKAEMAVKQAAEKVRIARDHIDGDNGAFLPVAQRIVDLYGVPLTAKNAKLVKSMGYAYTGEKSSPIEPQK